MLAWQSAGEQPQSKVVYAPVGAVSERIVMLPRIWLLLALVIGGFGLVGCGGAPGEQHIEVPKVDPIDEAKGYLRNYANGQPVTSEATAFPKLVEDVKKVDPAKGEILEKGLAEIQASPATAADKAKELLEKL